MFGIVEKDRKSDDAVINEWINRLFKELPFNEAMFKLKRYSQGMEETKQREKEKINRGVYEYQPIRRRFGGS